MSYKLGTREYKVETDNSVAIQKQINSLQQQLKKVEVTSSVNYFQQRGTGNRNQTEEIEKADLHTRIIDWAIEITILPTLQKIGLFDI